MTTDSLDTFSQVTGACPAHRMERPAGMAPDGSSLLVLSLAPLRSA